MRGNKIVQYLKTLSGFNSSASLFVFDYGCRSQGLVVRVWVWFEIDLSKARNVMANKLMIIIQSLFIGFT